MSVLNWIVSQFDYLFFIQGVPATPTVTAKTKQQQKHLEEMAQLKWFILRGVFCSSHQSLADNDNQN